jgi:hypothetical protein
LAYVSSVVTVCHEWLSDEKRSLPTSLFEVASLLHDALPELPSDHSLVNDIVRLCEAFWFQKRPNREQLLPSSLVFSPLRTNEHTSTKPQDEHVGV